MQTSADIHLLVYLQNITLLLVASYSEQKLIAVFTHSLFHHPQLWHSIYPLSFFRQRNLRWPFCLRCLHEIHCKSVRNLRPQHAPVIVICPVSVTIICSHAPPPHPPKKRYDIRTQTDTKTDRHLLHSVHFDLGDLQLAFHHRYTWLLKYNSCTTIPIFLSPTVCCHLFSLQASSNYPLWIRIRQEYYTSFQMCHWCSLIIPLTKSCQCPKASSNQLWCYDLLSFKNSTHLHQTTPLDIILAHNCKYELLMWKANNMHGKYCTARQHLCPSTLFWHPLTMKPITYIQYLFSGIQSHNAC